MKTVYVGMSGGVDSSVTAALLKSQGYSVVGVYMKNWTADVAGVACPWKQDLADARATAAKIDIPFKVFDFLSEYKQFVVDVMVAEYMAGRTPNPDVMCNGEIKFKLFLAAALADGADLIATGHYARTSNGRLKIAKDTNKDQSYFLYRVTSDALDKTLFPLGDLTKPEVRVLAANMGLPTAKKPDSQGICFVGEVGIKAFLNQYIETVPGPIVDRATGVKLGDHSGAVYFTTGQRHGLGLGGGKPYYVTSKDMALNTVYVTADPVDQKLETSNFKLANIHWINEPPTDGREYLIRTRYRNSLVKGKLLKTSAGYDVSLEHPERAVTAGQSAVVYDGDLVVGGGIIS